MVVSSSPSPLELEDALLLDNSPGELDRDHVSVYVEEEELKDIERQIDDIFDELRDLEVRGGGGGG